MRMQYIPGYNGKVFRTNQGTLLLFMGGAEKWLGPWPNLTWDILYDNYAPRYMELTANFTKMPLIWIGPHTKFCRGPIIGGRYGEFQYLVSTDQYGAAKKLIIKPRCNNITNFKCCSFDCWYLSEQQAITNDIKYAVHHGQNHTVYMEKLRHFRQAFSFLRNRWTKYRQKWQSNVSEG